MSEREWSCPAYVEGCAECEREAAFERERGHDCREEDKFSQFTSLCTVWGDYRRKDEEMHRLSHEPSRCEACRAIVSDKTGYDVLVKEHCRIGCVVLRCPYCRERYASWGEVGCRICNRPEKRPVKIRRMHSMYKAAWR